MILDQLSQALHYYTLNKRFKAAFDFLKDHQSKDFNPQRLHLDGDDLIAIFEAPEVRGHGGARLEAHKKYIDIQYTFQGLEEIGWKPHDECKILSQPYNSEKDIEFFADVPILWLPIPSGSFAIFYPHDAHAPLAASKPVQKIIMKVAVN